MTFRNLLKVQDRESSGLKVSVFHLGGPLWTEINGTKVKVKRSVHGMGCFTSVL